MKYINFILMNVLVLIFIPVALSTTASAVDKDQTDVSITIIKEKGINKGEDDKKNQYNVTSPKELKRLPQTGELLGHFILFLVGTSLILFVSMLFINKSYVEYLRWEL